MKKFFIKTFSKNNYECQECGEIIAYEQYEESYCMSCPNCGSDDIEREC